MSIRTLCAAALIVLTLIAGCEGASPTPTPVPPTAALPPLTGSGGGRIAFESKRDGNYEIYVMNADGTDQRRLTRDPHEDEHPAWSPDGIQIAFASSRHGHFDIYVMNADGSNLRRLTTKGDAYYPAWSPDGTRIAFSDDGDIYVMNADGSNRQRLTQTSADMDVFDPHWSPDGTQIVCVGDSDPDPLGQEETIHVLNFQGALQSGEGNIANLRPLPRAGSHLNDRPNWSPKGSEIAFSAKVDDYRGIYVVNADGTDLRRLTQAKDVHEFAPAWSPGGTQIVFQSDADGNWDIYIMNADGTGQRRLTTDAANDGKPDWVP